MVVSLKGAGAFLLATVPSRSSASAREDVEDGGWDGGGMVVSLEEAAACSSAPDPSPSPAAASSPATAAAASVCSSVCSSVCTSSLGPESPAG